MFECSVSKSGVILGAHFPFCGTGSSEFVVGFLFVLLLGKVPESVCVLHFLFCFLCVCLVCRLVSPLSKVSLVKLGILFVFLLCFPFTCLLGVTSVSVS